MPEVMLDGTTSDPVTMGWMQGSPPPPERRIRAADAGHMRFPMTRWAFSHMREFCPSQRVGGSAPAPLPRALREDLGQVTVTPADGTAPLSLDAALTALFTDGLLVLHRGTVVFERWFGVTGPETRHIAFSVTKSFVGTLAEMAVEDGSLDEGARVGTLLPELAGSVFGDATVRQVMDMTTALDFSEAYADPNSGIAAYSAALGLAPRPDGYAGPTDLASYLPTIAKNGAHGDGFTYRTPNTEVLAWITQRATGRLICDLLSDRLWAPLGLADADLIVDPSGAPFAGGGLCLRLEDLARFGEVVRNGGQGVIPAGVLGRIAAGGDPAKFPVETYPLWPGASYRSQWWLPHDAHGTWMARGIHGQALWIDAQAEVTIARFGSHPIAANGLIDPLALPVYRAIVATLSSG